MPSCAKGRAGKPPYRIPLVSEVAALPWNGLTVASTFSGCGGSCFGYRMSGYRVAWANEFVSSAQESYLANCSSGCYLDPRDIKLVTADEILNKLKMKVGELDLFDGSPPCQAFSTAGKRHKGWGKEKAYSNGINQLNETLFWEWLRLLKGLMPKTFVAENVSGLVKGVCKGTFLEILKEMKKSGYRVIARILDAQWLGVPQQRQRVIFIGVREDLRDQKGNQLQPHHPDPLPYRYSVREVITYITRVRVAVGFNREEWILPNRPYTTVGTASNSGCNLNGNGGKVQVEGIGTVESRKFTIAELKRICGFPDDFILKGSYAQQWACLGNSVPPPMAAAVAVAIRDGVLRKVVAIK